MSSFRTLAPEPPQPLFELLDERDRLKEQVAELRLAYREKEEEVAALRALLEQSQASAPQLRAVGPASASVLQAELRRAYREKEAEVLALRAQIERAAALSGHSARSMEDPFSPPPRAAEPASFRRPLREPPGALSPPFLGEPAAEKAPWSGRDPGRLAPDLPANTYTATSDASQGIDFGAVAKLSPAELDALPYGLITLDAEGRVLHYNDTEARLVGLPRERVLGRNFFRDVAPCTRLRDFEGRFVELARDPGRVRVQTFDFVFRFPRAEHHVTVIMTPARTRGQFHLSLVRRAIVPT